MKRDIVFDYFHDFESEQFAFYRIPKMLFTDDYFKELSSDAKILYGLMLDRMSLSIKNRWVDEKDRVYIIFTLEQVMECMNCGKDKGIKILAELDTDKGIGLIKRIKQGLGKPALIYVKSFIIKETSDKRQKSEKPKSVGVEYRSAEVEETEVQKSEKPKSEGGECRSTEVRKTEVQRSKKPKSIGGKTRSAEVGNTEPNNTYYIYTDLNDTNLINQSKGLPDGSENDKMDKVNIYRDIIRENVEYDFLIREFQTDEIDELIDLILEVVCSRRETIWIAGAELPFQFVKSKFLKLDSGHLRYVIESLKSNPQKIHNIKSYLLAALFNATSTINQYYKAEVNHDMNGFT